VGVTYATGFGGYAPGAEPSDWTQTSGSYTWTVSTDSNALYGRSAAVTALTSAGFKTWNAVPSTADVEILLIAKVPASITSGDAFFRPSCRVDATGANGYFADWQYDIGSPGLNIFKRVSNTNTLLSNLSTKNFSAGAVVAMRFRVVGTALSLKAWLWSGTEPASWDISIADSAITASGLVGIRKAAATQTDAYYWFSVATGGDTALSPFFPGTGSFTVSGRSATFQGQELLASGTYALTGRFATFQAQGPAAFGSFVLTGAAATFRTQLGVAFGAFALIGQPAPLQVEIPAAVASFTLAGRALALQAQLSPTFGAFALSGQLVAFNPIELVSAETFTLTGEPVDLSYDLLGGGSSISGGTFSRQRWREILAEEERRRVEAERHIRAEKLRRKAERCRREAAFAEARRRSREQARTQADAAIAALAAHNAAAAARGVDELKRLAAHAGAQARAAHAARTTPDIDDDEEEAIALLLLAHADR
jgi:hypothetical protein